MFRISKDPLLAAAQIVLLLSFALLALGTAALVMAAGAFLTVQREEIFLRIAQAGAPQSAYWAGLGLILLFLIVFLAGLRFLLELNRIVRSVDAKEPFDPANASRLARMAWLVAIAQILLIPASMIAAWLYSFANGIPGYGAPRFGPSAGGLLLILTLFILARVFRKGAEMREDIEGTI